MCFTKPYVFLWKNWSYRFKRDSVILINITITTIVEYQTFIGSDILDNLAIASSLEFWIKDVDSK